MANHSDYNIKLSDKRNAPVAIGYICGFVCMVSKAIHSEAVVDFGHTMFHFGLEGNNKKKVKNGLKSFY